MLFENITIVDADFHIARNMYVGTKDKTIAYVSPNPPDERTRAQYGETYDGNGKLLMPGFYNAHAHNIMTVLRGWGEGLPLQSWLNDKIFPFEAQLSDENTYWPNMLGIAEMLRFGTVSFSDMYFFPDARGRSVIESGIKCNIAGSISCFDDSSYEELPAYAINEYMLREFHGYDKDRIKIDLAPHSEYLTTPKVLAGIVEQAQDKNLNIQIHMSATKTEHEECKQRHDGMTPARYLESLGVFRRPTTVAHAVWTEPEDWKIMADNGVTVACNPVSNMKLASGFAPIKRMQDANIRLALGTDGCASNNNLNIAQDLYLFALIAKGESQDPTAITTAQAMRTATRNGALAQGRVDSGSIKTGYRADLVIRDVDVPWMYPATDVMGNLIYASQGADVVLTMVDGKVLYRDGEWPTIDVEKAQAETQSTAQGIIASL